MKSQREMKEMGSTGLENRRFPGPWHEWNPILLWIPLQGSSIAHLTWKVDKIGKDFEDELVVPLGRNLCYRPKVRLLLDTNSWSSSSSMVRQHHERLGDKCRQWIATEEERVKRRPLWRIIFDGLASRLEAPWPKSPEKLKSLTVTSSSQCRSGLKLRLDSNSRIGHSVKT